MALTRHRRTFEAPRASSAERTPFRDSRVLVFAFAWRFRHCQRTSHARRSRQWNGTVRGPADQELAMPTAPFNRYALPLLSLALLPLAGAAQSAPVVRLSLSDAIAAAWTASADARAADYALAAAAGRTRQAGARPNPILSYGREQSSADGFGTSQDILALEQRIELGGHRSARIAAARAREQAADARLAVERSQVEYETTRAYAMALAARHRVQLANQAGDICTRAVK